MRDKLLSILDESPLPITTPDLIALCDDCESSSRVVRARLRARVWSSIALLCAGGLVRKITEKGHKSGKTVRWVATKFDHQASRAK